MVRNFVSGAINRSKKDPRPEDLRRIRFVAYQVIEPKLKPSDQFKFLEKVGFYTAPHVREVDLSEDELLLKEFSFRLFHFMPFLVRRQRR